MKTRGGRGQVCSGFTIVEVLIVLAASGALLVVASAMISGRQAKTEFNIGARDVRQRLQGVVNEVASGYYNRQAKMSCFNFWGTAIGPDSVSSGDTTDYRGANSRCIFAGDAVTFFPSASELRVYPLAGIEIGESNTLGEFGMTPLASAVPKNYDTLKLTGGMTYYGAKINTAPVDTAPLAILFLGSLGNRSEGSGSSQQVSLYGLSTANLEKPQGPPYDESRSPTWIKNEWAQGRYNDGRTIIPTEQAYPKIRSAELCFKSGGTNQSVIVAFSNSTIEATYTIKQGLKCGW